MRDFASQVMGMGNDGNIYFLDRHGWLTKCSPRSITQGFLLTLKDLHFWNECFPKKENPNWPLAISMVIELANGEFDPEKIKGVGAWRSKDGSICFHNGNKNQIKGECTEDWFFTRKVKKYIGLDAAHTPLNIRKEISETVQALSFQNRQEAIRVLSWATLAPFAGALTWRPALLLTGGSGSGKTEVVKLVILPLASSLVKFISGSSSEAGIRQATAIDACPIIIEESESDTVFERENRNNQMKLMRQSTSDDAPSILKGGKDGDSQTFGLRGMFAFIGIDPSIAREADANRIATANVVKPPDGGDPNWPKNRDALKRLMVKENMDGIRALVWSNLSNIIRIMDLVISAIQKETGLSSRFATAEAPLIGVYIFVWLGIEKPTGRQLSDIVKDFYKDFKQEKVDEVAEFLDRILDQAVNIFETKEAFTFRQMLEMLNTDARLGDAEDCEGMDLHLSGEDKTTIKKTLGHYGIALANSDKKGYKNAVGIKGDNVNLMRKMQLTKGYHKVLVRHDSFANNNHSINVLGSVRAHYVFNNILNQRE
jgi:hypothetical protein